MTKRYCWECVYLYVDEGMLGYSERTPGAAPSLECVKGKFDTSLYRTKNSISPLGSPNSLKECLEMANTCKHFKLEEIK